ERAQRHRGTKKGRNQRIFIRGLSLCLGAFVSLCLCAPEQVTVIPKGIYSNTSTVVFPSANRMAVFVADPLSLFVRTSVAYLARPTRSWYRAGCPAPNAGSDPLERSHSSNTVRSVGNTRVFVSSQSMT